ITAATRTTSLRRCSRRPPAPCARRWNATRASAVCPPARECYEGTVDTTWFLFGVLSMTKAGKRIVKVLACAVLVCAGFHEAGFGQEKVQPADEKPVRIASGVSGHIHPAACVTKSGAVVVIFGQSDYKDLLLTRSTDGGRTWSKPVPFGPSE